MNARVLPMAAVLATVLLVPVRAAAAGVDVPPGGFSTREDATRALSAARRQHEDVEQTYAVEQQRCQRAFAVNACMDSARGRRDASRREIDRVELEAKDAQRRFDAADRAARRAERPADDQVERTRREAEARARQAERERAARAEEAQRQARDAEVPAKKARSQQRAAQRAREQAESAAATDPSVRAQNLQRFQERQRSAGEYAKRKAAEREENERKRAQRAAEAAKKQ